MIFNVTGGGTSLNFKVVGGTTQPASPEENTIWVKTNVSIPKYELGKDHGSPSWSMAKGFVYVAIEGGDNTGGKNFDVIKANNKYVYVCATGCIQNQDGTKNGWKRMNAYVHKSGSWVQFSSEWNGYYYQEGNEWSTITGGWKAETKIYGTDGNATITPTLTKSTDHMEFDLVRSDAGGYGATLRTQTAVDLTNVKTLYFDIAGQGSYKQYWLGAIPENGSAFAACLEKGTMDTFTIDRKAYEIDVSSLSGKYWIAISIYSASNSANALNIYNVYGK